jgi:hypothetical protein
MSPEHASPSRDAMPWRDFAVIVATLFIVFNLNFREIGGLDSVPNMLLPASVLRELDTDLDEFEALLRADDLRRKLYVFGTVQDSRGHMVSSYPIGSALVALPVYAVPVWAGWLGTLEDYHLMAKLAASLIVALSAGFLFLAAAEIAGRKPALLLALAYGLGSDAWTVASQSLWQHGPGMLCLAVALLLVLRMEAGAGRTAALGAGAALGLAVICRNLNAIPAGALGLFVLVRHRRQLIAFALPLAVCAIFQAWYNVTAFGDLRGGYDAIYRSEWHAGRGLTIDTAFDLPFWQGLAGILVSPSKGLFVYTPYMIFAVAALLPICFARSFPLGRYLTLWMVLLLYVLSKHTLWWGGSGFGPRYLCDALPGLILVLAWLWPWIAARRWRVTLFATTLALSVGVQAVGAFLTPCGWHENPVQVDYDSSRLWHWHDPQLVRCVSVGLRDGPRPFDFLEPDTTPDE